MEKISVTFKDEFLTTKEVAEALKKNLNTIQRWCRKGKLPAAKIGGTFLIRRKDFDDWFESKLSTSRSSVENEGKGDTM